MRVTRSDVLAIAKIWQAFDFSTRAVQLREVNLIRTAFAERLIRLTQHAQNAADDESIPLSAIWNIVMNGKPASKDLDVANTRQVGINFEGIIPGGRRIRTKIGWDGGYFVATVHSIRRGR